MLSGRVQQLAKNRSLWSARRHNRGSYFDLGSKYCTSSSLISDADILSDTSNDVGNDTDNDTDRTVIMILMEQCLYVCTILN